MTTSEKNILETETAKVELSGSDWRLRTTVSVTKGPMTVEELLPVAQTLADAVVSAAVKSVEESGQKISCKKGCGACCRQLVPIPDVEARHIRDLVNSMPEPRQSQIRARFADARRRLKESGLLEKLLQREQWREEEVQALGVQYFFQGIPCPFLEEESCSIHPDRPITCREYLVTSPAEHCARPSAETIDQIKLPLKIWPALARLDKAAASTRFVRWVPLVLALEWVDTHSTEADHRSGMELLRELFDHLSSGKKQLTDQNQEALDDISPRAKPHGGKASLFAGPSRASVALDSNTPAVQEFPLRIGRTDDFTRVESMFRTAQFDEMTICRMFDIGEMSDLGSIDPKRVDLSSRLGLLLRLFLLLESVPQVEVERWLKPDGLASLQRLDLVRLGAFGLGGSNEAEFYYYSPVWLYPVAGLLIASDRRTNPDGSGFSPMRDIVFPAIYEGSLRFLNAVANRSAGDALDLCCGSGVGALVLARSAKRVVACDITSRACHFARFNVLLNGCQNVEVANGDLYDAVGEENFDLIVAHPPYVPSVTQAMIYRDSGETGEALIRRLLAGLPDHLRPCGCFVSVCGGWDSQEGLFQERASSWLGHRKNEFRASFARERESSVEETAEQLPRLNDSREKLTAADWLKVLRKAGLERRVYGTLAIQRVQDNDLIPG